MHDQSKYPEAQVIHAWCMYAYNVSALETFIAVQGDDHHPDYVKEKCEFILKRGLHAYWGALDHGNRIKLAEVVWKQYGSEARTVFPEKWERV